MQRSHSPQASVSKALLPMGRAQTPHPVMKTVRRLWHFPYLGAEKSQ